MLHIASQGADVSGASKIRTSYPAVRLMVLSSNGGISGSESMLGESNKYLVSTFIKASIYVKTFRQILP